MRVAQQGRRRVLVVDDCAATRDILTVILEVEGHEVVCARNGREALARLRAAPAPDVVLLDLMMPVMNGYELLGVLKRDARLAPIPVVVFSGALGVGPDPVSLGAAACLPKPISEDSVIDCVVGALNAALAQGQPPGPGGR